MKIKNNLDRHRHRLAQILENHQSPHNNIENRPLERSYNCHLEDSLKRTVNPPIRKFSCHEHNLQTIKYRFNIPSINFNYNNRFKDRHNNSIIRKESN